jgi:hypothetical protein
MADRARIDLVMQDYGLSRADAAAAVVLSASLHLGVADIVLEARDCGCSVCDAGPAFVIGHYTHEPFAYVWRHRHGRRWREYGLDLGIDWGRFNTLYVSYDDFDTFIWLNLCCGAYGCDVALWDDLNGWGLGCWDSVVTVVLGDGHYDRCRDFALEYRHYDHNWGRTWNAIGPNWAAYRRSGGDSGRFDGRSADSWNGGRSGRTDDWNVDRDRRSDQASGRARRDDSWSGSEARDRREDRADSGRRSTDNRDRNSARDRTNQDVRDRRQSDGRDQSLGRDRQSSRDRGDRDEHRDRQDRSRGDSGSRDRGDRSDHSDRDRGSR